MPPFRLAVAFAVAPALAAPFALGAQQDGLTPRSGVPVTKSALAPVEAIAETERAFSRASQERGVRDAFLAYMADEGFLFRPNPVTARVWLVTNPPDPGTLTWTPAWGAASAAGDMGFTTGPYVYRRAATDTAPGTGQYLTVWLRQQSGGYRALLDIGVPGPTPTMADTAFTARPLAPLGARPAGGATAAGIVEAARATLFIADRGLAAAGAADGPATALAAVAATDIRVLRAGRAPAVGRDSLAAFFATPSASPPPAAWVWRTREARIARSGDFGVTHGTYEARDSAGAVAEQGNYVRVWARQPEGWRVLADIAAANR